VEAAAGSRDLDEYFDLLTGAMDLSLQHTPELLDVLKKAGVVDSGGAGLLYIAEGMRAALHGETAEMPAADAPAVQKVDLDAFTEDSVLEFGYCTEFLLRLQRAKVDLETFDETVLSDWLSQNGESLVFFRDGSIIKVHVHTRTPGEILNHCQLYGEFLTVKVENMTLQHHENHMDRRFKKNTKALGIVAVAAGEGLEATFREMGADAVIHGGQTMNPSVESFLDAFQSVQAQTILVFPNNGNILLTARQAAGLYKDARVEVVPTQSLGEGYYAMANMQPDLPIDELLASLEQAAASVTTGSVSRAVRSTDEAREGDYIGFCGKEILCSSPSREECLKELAAKLDVASADIVILLQGGDVPAEEAHAMQESLQKASPLSELILIDGKQAVYDYILVLC